MSTYGINNSTVGSQFNLIEGKQKSYLFQLFVLERVITSVYTFDISITQWSMWKCKKDLSVSISFFSVNVN